MINTSLMFNLEIEQSVLGAILKDKDLMLEMAAYNAELFYKSEHKELFKIFKAMNKNKVDIDVLTVCDYIRKHEITSVTMTYVVELDGAVATLVNFKSHLKALADYHSKRQIQELLYKKIDFTKPADELKDTILASLTSMGEDQEEEDTETFLNNYLEDYYNKDDIKGVKTGIKKLDNKIGGFEKGGLIGIVANQGIGKSTLGTSIAGNMIKSNTKMSIFSLEMPKNEVFNKIVAKVGRIDYEKLRRKLLSPAEEEKFIRVYNYLAARKELYNIYDKKFTIEKIVAQIKKDKLTKGIEIAFVDLLNRIDSSEYKNNNRAEFVSHMTRKLKLLALELNIPIVVMAQINRVTELRTEKRPTLADVKESGGLGEDADYIIYVYRNRDLEDKGYRRMLEEKGKLSYELDDPEVNPNRAELGILKGRFSGQARFCMGWNVKYQDFIELKDYSDNSQGIEPPLMEEVAVDKNIEDMFEPKQINSLDNIINLPKK